MRERTEAELETDAPAARERGLRQAVAALRHRPFRRFWIGAVISNLGTWMQNVTVPYVIYQVTRSATLVGLAALVQLSPSVIMGPLAGWLADRFDRRKVLMVGQSAQGLLAAAVWAAWVANFRSPVLLLVLLGLGGVAFGLVIPSWQAFITELVPRKDLLNAVTLNSAQFNGARAVGPAVAGLVLARFGPSWAFLVNALSFFAVVVSLTMVHPTVAHRQRPSRNFLKQFVVALCYARSHRGIRTAIGLVMAIFFLGNPVFQLAPVFAEQVFRVGPGLYGLLTAAYGAGAVAGGLLLGVFGNRFTRGRLVAGAVGLYAAGLAGFGLSRSYPLGVFFLFLLGVAFLVAIANLNTSVQLLVDEHMRGRVLAIYLMGLTGAYPLGAFAQGALSDRIGPSATVLLAAGALSVLWIVLVLRPELPGALDKPGGLFDAELEENVA